MIANIGSISSMRPRFRNAFAFRRRPYWSRLAAGATGGWVDLGSHWPGSVLPQASQQKSQDSQKNFTRSEKKLLDLKFFRW